MRHARNNSGSSAGIGNREWNHDDFVMVPGISCRKHQLSTFR
ncbi:Uncharacterized protein pbN1_03760 [Aromatoleum bremense]|nr:Uncharacterized protein pbN1_03760 [Aromatoleum bremense]